MNYYKNEKEAFGALLDYYPTDNELIETLKEDEPHDNITELSDSLVDIYTHDLLEWLPKNYYFVEDAIQEFGFPEDTEGKPDMIKAIMQGQYYAIEQDLQGTWETLKEKLEEWEELTKKSASFIEWVNTTI